MKLYFVLEFLVGIAFTGNVKKWDCRVLLGNLFGAKRILEAAYRVNSVNTAAALEM